MSTDHSTEWKALLDRFTTAIVANDGAGLAACFTPDGTYSDYIYGDFTGPDEIARLLDRYFHGDGKNYKWDMIDPVSDGKTGYARYLFSFTSTMPEYEGNRVVLEGTTVAKLQDGLIAHYHETADAICAMAQLGLPADVMYRRGHKNAKALLAREESQPHMAG